MQGHKGECMDTKGFSGTQRWGSTKESWGTQKNLSVWHQKIFGVPCPNLPRCWCLTALFPACGWCGRWSCACGGPLLCRAHTSHSLAWTADLHGCHPLRAYKSMNWRMAVIDCMFCFEPLPEGTHRTFLKNMFRKCESVNPTQAILQILPNCNSILYSSGVWKGQPSGMSLEYPVLEVSVWWGEHERSNLFPNVYYTTVLSSLCTGVQTDTD